MDVNLVLIGYRGSGKTTVGQMIARRLRRQFVDLDQFIVKQASKSIREIFETEGEVGFRERERDALRSLIKLKHHVVALGGGALVDPANRTLVRRMGRVVWLRAPAAVLWSRIAHDPASQSDRPDLTLGGGLPEVENLLREREAAYLSAADHVVDTAAITPQQAMETVELWFRADDAAEDDGVMGRDGA